ncbi:MAG: hypothetical protein ABWZ26_04360 [Candidatus Nanopelagicales bacterium]
MPRAAGRVLRTFPWPEVGIASGLAAALFAAATALTSSIGFWLVLLALAGCGGAAAYVLDEASGPVVDASPTSRRRRFGWRLGLVVVPAAVGVVGLAMVGTADPAVPWRRLLLVLAGYLAIGVMTAAVLRSRGRAAPGDLAAVVVALGTSLVVLVDPLHQWVPVLPYDVAGWSRTAALWILTIVACVGAVIVGLRDPAAAPLLPRRTRH